MSKLELTDTARVLRAALGSLTFTVAELAERSSANTATVRTVLFRAKDLLQEVGTVPNARAGRRAKRYRLLDSAREQLSGELTQLTAKFRSRDLYPDSRGAVEAAFAAAAASLQRVEADRARDIDQDALAVVRAQLDAARKLIPGIQDSAKRSAMVERLSELENQHRKAYERLESTPPTELGSEWFSPTDETSDFDDASLPVDTPSVSLSQGDRPACVWLDATDTATDAWSREIAAGLRDARCVVQRFSLHEFMASSEHRGELQRLLTYVEEHAVLFITMRSQETASDHDALRFLNGPLRPYLQRGKRAATRHHCTIAVIDHDLNENPFWIDNDIANLKYYPTAKPKLARVLAQRLVADKQSGMRTTSLSPAHRFMYAPFYGLTRKHPPFQDPAHVGYPISLTAADDRLSPTATALGFAAIENYLHRLASPVDQKICLIGVNRGGHLLGKLLAERHRVPHDALVNCDYDPGTQVLLMQSIPHDATLLILIDDVVRTGRTMNRVRAYLRDRHPNKAQLAIALAVVSPDYQGSGVPYDIDFCLWISPNPKLKFPWSDAEGQNLNPYVYLDTRGVNQVRGFLTDHSDTVELGDSI